MVGRPPKSKSKNPTNSRPLSFKPPHHSKMTVKKNYKANVSKEAENDERNGIQQGNRDTILEAGKWPGRQLTSKRREKPNDGPECKKTIRLKCHSHCRSCPGTEGLGLVESMLGRGGGLQVGERRQLVEFTLSS